MAIGRSWSEPARATRELETLFRCEWSHGMLPHIRFDPRMAPADHFPGAGLRAHGTGAARRVERGPSGSEAALRPERSQAVSANPMFATLPTQSNGDAVAVTFKAVVHQ
jgi:hypothetical protein